MNNCHVALTYHPTEVDIQIDKKFSTTVAYSLFASSVAEAKKMLDRFFLAQSDQFVFTVDATNHIMTFRVEIDDIVVKMFSCKLSCCHRRVEEVVVKEEDDEKVVKVKEDDRVVHIPYSGRIDKGCCQALIRACGLFTQCRGKLLSKTASKRALACIGLSDKLCNTCFQNMTTGRRKWIGMIQDRDKIVSVVKPYESYLKQRHGDSITKDDVVQLAKKQRIYFDPSLHFPSS